MGIARIRIITLAATLLIASCVQHQVAPEGPLESDAAVVFHNQGHDRIQVYLVGQRESWLLGRLEPRETAHLRLPESIFAIEGDDVVLAVLPGWSCGLAPRSDHRAAPSVMEPGRATRSGAEANERT